MDLILISWWADLAFKNAGMLDSTGIRIEEDAFRFGE
jgi:hypothetical protein